MRANEVPLIPYPSKCRPSLYFVCVNWNFYLHADLFENLRFLCYAASLPMCAVCLLHTLTPVLVSAMWWSVPHNPSLFAGVIRCGWAGAGRGHRAGQVSIHVIRVCATHWAAAGRCWGHWWHTAHTQRSATRDNRYNMTIADSSSQPCIQKHALMSALLFHVDTSWINTIIPGFSRGFPQHHKTAHGSKTEEDRMNSY